MQSVHRNVFKACTCAHTVVTGLHKYIWTIAQIQMCNCTNTGVLSSAVGQGSLAGNTGFVQASLHLQYVDAQEMHTCDHFWDPSCFLHLAGEDAVVLRGAVQRDHVEPLLGGDGVGGGVGPRGDRHRFARRVVRNRH